MTESRRPHLTGRDLPLGHPELLGFLRDFHGHIGPYVVLGYRLGEWARGRLSAPKYFGLQIAVIGPKTTPFTCLIDGLQTSTGCSLGKCNIALLPFEPPNGELFRITFGADERCLTAIVPEAVRGLFAGWLTEGPTEEEIMERVRAHPEEQLWRTAP